MNLTKQFAVTGASVPGHHHTGFGKSFKGEQNQDGISNSYRNNRIVSIICDGCSQGDRSYIGAQIVSRYLSSQLASMAKGGTYDCTDLTFEEQLVLASGHVFEFIDHLAYELTRSEVPDVNDRERVVSDYLLFTVLGVVIDPDQTYIFGVGDGVFYVNGERSQIQNKVEGKPAYMGYAIIKQNHFTLDELRLKTNLTIPTDQVKSLLIASDGLIHYEEAADKIVPGANYPVGPVNEWWERDALFLAPAMAQHKLQMMQRCIYKRDNDEVERQGPLLFDDTTIFVARDREFWSKQ